MDKKQLLELSEQANKQIEQGVESLKSGLGGGVDVMSLMMNPSKAVDQYGGGVMQIVEGMENMRLVMNELVERVAADEC